MQEIVALSCNFGYCNGGRWTPSTFELLGVRRRHCIPPRFSDFHWGQIISVGEWTGTVDETRVLVLDTMRGGRGPGEDVVRPPER